MATELEAWWEEYYDQYSLQDLESWDLFARFQTFTQPFRHEERNQVESFQKRGKMDVYTCEVGDTTEQLAHIPAAATWMYEKRATLRGSGHVWTTWKNAYSEWGQITHSTSDKTIKESWKCESGMRVYERVTVEGDVTTGQRYGSTQSSGSEPEVWSEKSLSSPRETRLERSWRQPGSSGGEVRGVSGGRAFGEYSFHSATASEKKQWSVEGGRDRGSCAGFTGKRKFTHKWDLGTGRSFEERSMQEGKRNWGVRKRSIGEKWFKEEWDGLPPVDACAGLVAVFDKCVELLAESEETLRALGQSAGRALVSSLPALDETDKHDPDTMATAVLNALKVALELERLKPRVSMDSASLQDLLTSHQNLLKKVSASPEADQGLIESALILEEQVQQLNGKNNSVDEYLRLLKDQTRILQVFTQQLLNHEEESRRMLKQVKTHLDFTLSSLAEECEQSENRGEIAETLSEIRSLSCVSDLSQVLSRLVSVLKSTAQVSQDPNFANVQSLMVDLKFITMEIAGLYSLSEESDSQMELEELTDPVLSTMHTGESVYRLLERIKDSTSEIEEIQHSEVVTVEEVRSEMEVIIQRKVELIDQLNKKLETKTKLLDELNKELVDLRNVNRQLKITEENLLISEAQCKKAVERAEEAEKRLREISPQ